MHQSENLPETSIRKFTGFHNPEYKKKYTVYIGTSFVFAQPFGSAGRKM